MNALIATVFLFIISVSAAQKPCQHPPSVWCSSEDVARACQVEEQCRAYHRRSDAADKVNLVLYFESLCPDCQRFMKTQLWKAYNAVGDIMNLTLVPYGNAHVNELRPLWPLSDLNKGYDCIFMSVSKEKKQSIKDEWLFTCQHGKEECVGNLIETCAIAIIKNFTEYFTFIHCMEVSTSDHSSAPEKAAAQCAQQLNVKSIDDIMSCSRGSMGNKLEHQMAVMTEALNPPHKYVPWVTLNGVHTEEIQSKAQSDLVSLICDTYKGPKPAACNKNTLSNRCQRKENTSVLKWLPLVGSQ